MPALRDTTPSHQRCGPVLGARPAVRTAPNCSRAGGLTTGVRAQAAAKPTYKAMRAEWAKMDVVPDVYSRTLHVANLAAGFKSDAVLKALFEAHGTVNHCRVATSKNNSDALCYAFVSFDRADHCDAAFRALDGSTIDGVGTLVICFVNPCKFSDARNARLSAVAGGRGRGSARGRYAHPHTAPVGTPVGMHVGMPRGM